MGLTAGIIHAAEGIREFRFGEVRVWALQDAAAAMPRTLFAAAGKPLPDTFPEQFPASVNVFLVRSRNCNILIDTGYGPDRGALAERLAALGIAPARIDAVFLTHIHLDHANGLLDAAGKAAFPAAKLYVAEAEYASCRPELAHCLEPYRDRLIRFAFGRELPGGPLGAVGARSDETSWQYRQAALTGYHVLDVTVDGSAIRVERIAFSGNAENYRSSPSDAFTITPKKP